MMGQWVLRWVMVMDAQLGRVSVETVWGLGYGWECIGTRAEAWEKVRGKVWGVGDVGYKGQGTG